jgi:hypothetical protein
LLILGNLLSITTGEGEGGRIEQGLPREQPPEGANEDEPDRQGRECYNAAVDALESIVLAHACAGVKVDDPRYVIGLETALDAFSNQF